MKVCYADIAAFGFTASIWNKTDILQLIDDNSHLISNRENLSFTKDEMFISINSQYHILNETYVDAQNINRYIHPSSHYIFNINSKSQSDEILDNGSLDMIKEKFLSLTDEEKTLIDKLETICNTKSVWVRKISIQY